MSLQEQLTECVETLKTKLSGLKGERFNAVFSPQTTKGIKRLQIIRATGIGLVFVAGSYGIAQVLFSKNPTASPVETPKLVPTMIESTAKQDLSDLWRYKMEQDLKTILEEVKALKTSAQKTPAETEENLTPNYVQDFETRLFKMEAHLDDLKQTPLPQQGPESMPSPESTEGLIINKFSLELSENPKHNIKTVETTIPASAFAKTVLLSGIDASASMNASSDPRPMLLRLIDHGTLPRRFQSDLKDCHCIASAYGDLSSERVYGRLEKLTCIERSSGEIIETQVAGYIAGSDGKAGIRGIVTSKDGQFLARSLVGGIFSGLSNVAGAQNRQPQGNPFFNMGAPIAGPTMMDNFTTGMASGAATALDRLSQYYIDRAEQLQPVIQVAAGQVVDIVFTEGTFIGSQSIKSEIEKKREETRSSNNMGKEKQ